MGNWMNTHFPEVQMTNKYMKKRLNISGYELKQHKILTPKRKIIIK